MDHAGSAPALELRRLVHELNTPLGVANMAGSLLSTQAEGLLESLGPERRAQLDEPIAQWRETLDLLQSCLQLCVQLLRRKAPDAQSDVTELQPQIDLYETLRSAAAMQLARHAHLQVQLLLQMPNPLRVHGSRTAWQQVVGNLVGNSLLHGFAASGHGTIRITAVEQPPGRLLLNYHDDGCGLDAQAHQRLFEDGFSTRLGRGGNGLGMGIVRDLVEHTLGGRLEVHYPARGMHISIEAPCRGDSTV